MQGDVDGKGFDDLLIGAPENDVTDKNAGAAYVFLGGSDFNANQTETVADADLRVLGTTLAEKFGQSVSGIGDFNGDGVDDFAVHGNDQGSGTGRIHVYYGGQQLGGADPLTISCT